LENYEVRVEVVVEAGGRKALDEKIARLLVLVDREGSILAAARALGMVYSRAWEAIEKAEQRINETLRNMEGGNFTPRNVAQVIGQDKLATAGLIGRINKVVMKKIAPLHAVKGISQSFRKAARCLCTAVETALNYTKANDTEKALEATIKAQAMVNVTIIHLNKVIVFLNKTGVNETYIMALENAANGFKSVQEKLGEAITSLKENDTEGAIMLLDEALDELKTTLNDLSETLGDLGGYVKDVLSTIMPAEMKLRYWQERHVISGSLWLGGFVKKLLHRTEIEYHLYLDGKISKDTFLKHANHTLTVLEALKSRLEKYRAPKPLIHMVEQAIAEIQGFISNV